MAFRNVRTMSRFCSYSSGPVPRFLLLCCNAAPRTTILSSSSTNFRYFSSETSTPVPSETAENRINSMVKNFSVSSMFQNWKNKFQPVKEVPVVDAKEETNRTAIDLGLTSVVKVFTVSSKPRIFQPWQISMESQCTGSGFVISGKRILTNAHVVADHTSVKVRKHGSPKKYKAKVRAIGHECDLAVLEVNNEEFWEGMNSLELADIPPLSAEVFVVGYPEGGDTISVTKGVVSRVGLTEYSHTATELMTIQIDAAINSGNSGGPAIMGNKVAGVAFESLFFADNIGYIIPTPIINRFLDGVEESGQHVSFCSINLTYMTMENDDNRGFFQMSKEMTGILIREINPLSGARKFLKEQDVILAIDGVPIGNDSKVRFRNNERINFEHLISMKKPCDTALFKVLREGKVHEFNINLKPVQPLVPVHQFDKPPSYYIFGGIVFTPLSQPYIDRAYICECATKKMSKKDGEQIIIISQIFEDDITTGHDHCEDKQVKKVNGVQVDNLKHLCQLIEECSTKYLKLDLEEGIVLSLNYKSAEKATSKILKNLKIPSAKSDDLQPKQLNMRRNVPRQIKKR